MYQKKSLQNYGIGLSHQLITLRKKTPVLYQPGVENGPNLLRTNPVGTAEIRTV